MFRNIKSTWLLLVVLLLVILFVNAGKIPNEDEAGRQIHDHKLSDQEHYVDSDNDKKMEHNTDYDHEAFLGKDEADKFKELTTEESKEKLGKIVAKIDKDHDDFINESELQEWLKNVTKTNIMKEVEQKWEEFGKVNTIEEYLKHYYGALDFLNKIDKNHDGSITQNELRNWIRYQHKYFNQKHTDKIWAKVNSNNDDQLTFDELIDNTIGGTETWSDEEKESKKDDYKVYLKLMERDKKKFKAADLDGDGKLSKNEFSDFLHPEESIQMRDIVINETIEDIDKNGDGVISIEEFLGDIYRIKPGQDDELAKVEIENFKNFRDKNGDSVLDREEIGAWILPNDYDHTLNEAKHLIYEADDNKDGKLTKEEILNNFNLFVSSRATSYGKAIYEKEDL